MTADPGGVAELKFRDPGRARELTMALARLAESRERAPVTLMHVCGTHEQAIARFGLRSSLPPGLRVIMGPGCPVCVTDFGEVDEGVALALQGVRIATYGDMVKLPGSSKSLADAQTEGARVEVVYSATQAVELARATDEPVVFFASGFETTAVTTAAILLARPHLEADRLRRKQTIATTSRAAVAEATTGSRLPRILLWRQRHAQSPRPDTLTLDGNLKKLRFTRCCKTTC